MKVIMLSDVKKVGKKGEIVDVSDGYAKNFLFRQKLAVQLTKGSMQTLDEQNRQAELAEQEKEKQAEATKAKLETIVLEFQVKSGKDGRVFGSVSTKQIVEQLAKKHNIRVEKRKIIDSETITSLGYTNVKIDLYKNKVIGVIRVHVKGTY
ncbi:MAG: 50S ribosomal protein L9 [Longicatena sp.]|jgi:large subunit ribosomal protein L9|nr:50S ribosomal protein L9 [Longicatena sp.]